ncbi:MAG: gliding motility-associated C-terminal domain-containing protein [Bacteroidales bacterium]|jgi:gliding motility-associated-like protein|nr:gliding motility-associated C-terminal domain-containing protein [Bacteroidales bacterium]
MNYFTNHITAILTGLLLMIGIVGYGQQDPVIEYVNVDSDGKVTIKWKEPPSGSENARYIILRWDYLPPGGSEAGHQPIATIDASELNYVDENAGADRKKQIYRIKLEGDETKESKEMQTIFLDENIIYDECELTNTFRWTAFFSTFSPLVYKISASIDGGLTYSVIDAIAAGDLVPAEQISTYENASPALTNVYEYTHQNLDPDNVYSYKIEVEYAVENEPQISSSNLQSRNTPAYDRPDAPVIKRVSVEPNGSIVLEGEITGSGIINGLEVWRTESENSSDLAIYQSPQNSGIGSIIFTDDAASSSQTAYWYDLVLLDYCNKNILAENAHRSIFLSAEVLPNESVELSWSAYEGWAVEGYRVFRKLGDQPFQEIAFENNTNFTDNTLSQTSEVGKISYFVMADAVNQPAGEDITSSSNRVSIGFDSELFMPNAFKPEGITKVFKPISRFEPNSDYLFQIYNRWGQLIFETRDFLTGWDGSYNGNSVSRGTYIWMYRYTDSQGNNMNKRGSVTVVY